MTIAMENFLLYGTKIAMAKKCHGDLPRLYGTKLAMTKSGCGDLSWMYGTKNCHDKKL